MTKKRYPNETPEERKARRYAQSRRWAKENPELTRSYGRRHYQKNPEKRRANSLAYYHAHKAERAAYNRSWYERKKKEDPDYFARQNEHNKAYQRQKRERRRLAAESCPLPMPLPKPYALSYEARVRNYRQKLNLYTFRAMERDRAACGDRVDAYFAAYPFEEYGDAAIRRRLAWFGIHPGKGEYADCYDAGMLAYLYTIHRCAVLERDDIVPYLVKMVRIYIACACVVYRDSYNLCRVNHLHEIRMDAEGMQRRY